MKAKNVNQLILNYHFLCKCVVINLIENKIVGSNKAFNRICLLRFHFVDI